MKEPRRGGASTLVNIGIGLVIGLAVTYFLLVPAAESNAKNEAQAAVTEISNELNAKTARIQELEAQVEHSDQEIESLNQELEDIVGADGTLHTIDGLLTAAASYLETQDLEATAASLENIAQSVDLNETSEGFQSLYRMLLASIGPDLSKSYYDQGYEAYRTGDYATAIDLLSKAVNYDETNADALLQLGQAYDKNGDAAEAAATYDKVIGLFPDTANARRAQSLKNALPGQ